MNFSKSLLFLCLYLASSDVTRLTFAGESGSPCVSPEDFKKLQDRVAQLEQIHSNDLLNELHSIPQRIEIIAKGVQANDEQSILHQFNYIQSHILKDESLHKISKSLWSRLSPLQEVPLDQRIDLITSLASPQLSIHILTVALKDLDGSGTLKRFETLSIWMEAFKKASEEKSNLPVILGEKTEIDVIQILIRNFLAAFPESLEESKIVQNWVESKEALDQILKISFTELSEVGIYDAAAGTLKEICQTRTLSLKELDLLMSIYYGSSPLLSQNHTVFSSQDYKKWREIFTGPCFVQSLEADLKERVLSKNPENTLRFVNIYLDNVWGYFRKFSKPQDDVLYTKVAEIFFQAIQNGSIPRETESTEYEEFILKLLKNPATALSQVVPSYPFILNDTLSIATSKYGNKRENIKPVLQFLYPLISFFKLPALTKLFPSLHANNQLNGNEVFQVSKFLYENNLTESSLWAEIPTQAQILIKGVSLQSPLILKVHVHGASGMKAMDVALKSDLTSVGLKPQASGSTRNVWIFTTKRGEIAADFNLLVENYAEGGGLALVAGANGVETLIVDGNNTETEDESFDLFEPSLSEDGVGFYLSVEGKFIEVLKDREDVPQALGLTEDPAERALFLVAPCSSC